MSPDSTHLARADQDGVRYRPIPDFPGYCAGDDGTIWTCLRQVHLGYRYGSRWVLSDQWRQKVATFSKRWRRLAVTLRRNKKSHGFWVHQLVLLAFVGPSPDGMECCHWDGNRVNNRLENLRWDTRKANHADQRRHGTAPVGERNPAAVLDVASVQEIRRLVRAGGRVLTVARAFYVSADHVRSIARGRTWGHLPNADGTPFRPIKRAPGVDDPRAKLTTAAVAEIIAALRSGEFLKPIAARHGVARATVIRINFGTNWAHVCPEIPRPVRPLKYFGVRHA